MPSQLYRLMAPFVAASLSILYPSVAAAVTHQVGRGGDLQDVLNRAAPGDVILLAAGVEYVGNFVLPLKAGILPIVLRTAPSALLPADGQRIRLADAPLLARLRSPNSLPALRTAAATQNWELRYLEFAGTYLGYGDILRLGDGSQAQDTLAKVPQQLLLAHLYIHGDPLVGQKRCVALNAAHVTIRDSHIADCKGVGMDTQAIGGWNGPGPYVIENNYLEGAGENVLFGGSDPAIPNLVADGIIFRRNHVARPMSWRQPIIPAPAGATAGVQSGGSLGPGTYAYRIVARRPVGQGTIGRSTASVEATAVVSGSGAAVLVRWQAVPHATEYRVYGRTPGGQDGYWTVTGTSFVDTGGTGTTGAVPATGGSVWTVKNLFELKNARNVVIQDNIFERHWREAQPGFAIVFTPRNSGGACTWCVVENVRMEYNIVRHVAAGINLLGYDSAASPSLQTKNIVVRHNLFYDMGGAYGGSGWFLQIGDEPCDIVADHNTIAHTGTSLTFVYGGTATNPRRVLGFRFTNNAARHGSYGINGQSFSYGMQVIEAYFPDSVVTGNYLAGGPSARYPAGNRFGGVFEAEFENAAAWDFRLRSDSQLRRTATDGGDIGADVVALLARTAAVESGEGGGVPPLPAPAAPGMLRIVR